MKDMIQKKTLIYGILIIFTPIMLFLTYYSFRYSMRTVDTGTGSMIADVQDSILLHIISFCLFLLLVHLIGSIFGKCKRIEFCLNIFLIVVMIISFLGCFGWVVAGNFFPQNDSRMVLESMESIRNGDYHELLPAGYIGAYQQQLGLVTIFNFIFTVARTTDDLAVQIVNVICVPVIIYAGYHVVKEISSKYMMRISYCLFMLFCFPLFFYTPYVYGEILSVTGGTIFIWAAICYLKRGKITSWIALSVCSVIGNMTRGNFLILLIAFAIIAFLYSIKRKK